EKKEELKKPTEPKKDRNAEVLLRVIDGELRLRVEAHLPADILNVLQIAEEFNAALILEGATGAHLVADRLAELEVPVVLSAPPAPVVYVPGAGRHTRPDAAAILREAGVDVYFGSGVLSSPTAAPQLALRVARAVGHGFDADAALETITFKAAGLLGVEKEIGRVKRGLRADLVIWSDHPFAPGATVERAFVGGREVYHADSDKEGRDE
ncbi:MAG TPA: amidohydrolase family protein, partial [Phycisphaerae bacterium]|nr:amidohydrolase family protein [Phycisphaerae bacterium]